jgi:single-stranded-DNA-specific exonuclease
MKHHKRWLVAPGMTPEAHENLQNFHPVVQQLLFNRGYATSEEANAYINGNVELGYDPFRLIGMQKAVDRIGEAINSGELIAIYGDYDVDGVTATALLVETIRALGGNVKEYIPNRFDEGYGLNNEALFNLMEIGVKVIISVDCGIRSINEADYVRSIGLDLIISDHHQPENRLPNAYAVINPKQDGDLYPDKDLAGVGIAYKIAEALTTTFPVTKQDSFDPNDLLDLVALGTVADLAPLVGENRALVRKGLRKIRETKRQGLFSLAAVSDISLPSVTATTIGFSLGPRLNAAGRLESALAAYDLLTAKDVMRAGELAQQLNNQNRLRQELTRKIQDEADMLVTADDPDNPILFATHPDFNSGVAGLVASRLVETYYRPAIVGQVFEETTRCSCRSIREFHITEALDRCKDLLMHHGGHAAAAGFTVKNENMAELKNRLQSIAYDQLGGRELRQTLAADMEIPLIDLKPDLLRMLEYLQPTGYGNPEAVFVSRNLRITRSRRVGADGKHLKLTLTDGRITFDAIGFRLGDLLPEIPPKVDIIFTFESNEFNGRSSLQLNLKDIKEAGIPDI